MPKNKFEQPIGFPLDNWKGCPPPPRTTMTGRYCRVESLEPATHAEQLFKAHVTNRQDQLWTYLPYGPYDKLGDYQAWIESVYQLDDPVFYAIIDQQSGQAVGVASYLRISPDIGSIEVGHINFSPQLQKTPAATEAMFLMMRHAFDELGYRRYEWKCDALNEPSRKAAKRLGFQYEGVFRQHTMYKGRNRDTAWFSILDSEWPALKAAFEKWLNPSNFDGLGNQRQSLSAYRQS
ncbi:MAG: GNAT family protein [Chloroflexota bacterium]